jgi:hypothetical protein
MLWPKYEKHHVLRKSTDGTPVARRTVWCSTGQSDAPCLECPVHHLQSSNGYL